MNQNPAATAQAPANLEAAADIEAHHALHQGFFKLFGEPLSLHGCRRCGRPLTNDLCDKCDFGDLPPAA